MIVLFSHPLAPQHGHHPLKKLGHHWQYKAERAASSVNTTATTISGSVVYHQHHHEEFNITSLISIEVLHSALFHFLLSGPHLEPVLKPQEEKDMQLALAMRGELKQDM